MADFRRRPPHELQNLREQALVDYVDEAREAGELSALREALGYLAFSFEGIIKARVIAKVPPADADDVTMEVLHSVIRSGFEGKYIGQFGAFVRTVTQRRTTDYHRERERQPQLAPIDGGGGDEPPKPEPVTEEETGTVVILDAVERVLASRSELHQRIIRLYGPGMCGFADLPAAEVCDRLAAEGETVSVDNVAKVWSRFKKDLRRELGG